jgi:hypothetical protein
MLARKQEIGGAHQWVQDDELVVVADVPHLAADVVAASFEPVAHGESPEPRHSKAAARAVLCRRAQGTDTRVTNRDIYRRYRAC